MAKKTIEQVIKLFQRYAAGDPKWHGEVDWKPFKPKWPLYRGLRNHRQVNILATLFTFGFCAFIGALIFLISLAFVDNVSYVVAFRQLSIPLGAAFGMLALKEPGYRPKLAGILVMVTGLVLVATG